MNQMYPPASPSPPPPCRCISLTYFESESSDGQSQAATALVERHKAAAAAAADFPPFLDEAKAERLKCGDEENELTDEEEEEAMSAIERGLKREVGGNTGTGGSFIHITCLTGARWLPGPLK
eukprot:6698218-Pyramimonas_sp.AAC.1